MHSNYICGTFRDSSGKTRRCKPSLLTHADHVTGSPCVPVSEKNFVFLPNGAKDS